MTGHFPGKDDLNIRFVRLGLADDGPVRYLLHNSIRHSLDACILTASKMVCMFPRTTFMYDEVACCATSVTSEYQREVSFVKGLLTPNTPRFELTEVFTPRRVGDSHSLVITWDDDGKDYIPYHAKFLIERDFGCFEDETGMQWFEDSDKEDSCVGDYYLVTERVALEGFIHECGMVCEDPISGRCSLAVIRCGDFPPRILNEDSWIDEAMF